MPPLSDQEVNELYDNIQNPKTEEAPTQSEQDAYELAEGVKVGKDDLINYAKEGYTYKQTAEDFKKKQEEFNQTYSKYSEIDKWAQDNPEQWSYVLENYNKNLTQNNNQNYNESNKQNSPDLKGVSPELKSYLDQINDINLKVKNLEGFWELDRRKKEDAALDEEINSIKEKYKFWDFSQKDEAGQTLEQKVLKHAAQIGVDRFEIAFRDLMHDKLIEKAREEGKEGVAKDLERKSKLGILGETKQSIFKVNESKNRKNKSYDELLREGLEDLGVKY